MLKLLTNRDKLLQARQTGIWNASTFMVMTNDASTVEALSNAIESGDCPPDFQVIIFGKQSNFAQLAKAITHKNAPPSLILQFNALIEGFETIKALSGALQAGTYPNHLTLNFKACKLSAESLQLLGDALSATHPGKKLTLELTQIKFNSPETLTALEKILQSGNKLDLALAISDTFPPPPILRRVCESLMSGKCHSELSLRLNISISAFTLLGEALSSGLCPQHLSLNLHFSAPVMWLDVLTEASRAFLDSFKSEKIPKNLNLSLDNEFFECVPFFVFLNAIEGGLSEHISIKIKKDQVTSDELAHLSRILSTCPNPNQFEFYFRLHALNDNNLENTETVCRNFPIEIRNKNVKFDFLIVPPSMERLKKEFDISLLTNAVGNALHIKCFSTQLSQLISIIQQSPHEPKNVLLTIFYRKTSAPSHLDSLVACFNAGNYPEGLHLQLDDEYESQRELPISKITEVFDALMQGNCKKSLRIDFKFLAKKKLQEHINASFLNLLQSGKCPDMLSLTIYHIDNELLRALGDVLKSGKCPPYLTLQVASEPSLPIQGAFNFDRIHYFIDAMDAPTAPMCLVLKNFDVVEIVIYQGLKKEIESFPLEQLLRYKRMFPDNAAIQALIGNYLLSLLPNFKKDVDEFFRFIEYLLHDHDFVTAEMVLNNVISFCMETTQYVLHQNDHLSQSDKKEIIESFSDVLLRLGRPCGRLLLNDQKDDPLTLTPLLESATAASTLSFLIKTAKEECKKPGGRDRFRLFKSVEEEHALLREPGTSSDAASSSTVVPQIKRQHI